MIYLSIFYKFRLQRIILLLVLAFYSLVLCAQFVDYERITPHPRLLLTQGGEEAVKKSIATFPSLLKVHKRILEESDEILIQQMAERVMEGKRLLSVSRLVLKRIFYLSCLSYDEGRKVCLSCDTRNAFGKPFSRLESISLFGCGRNGVGIIHRL